MRFCNSETREERPIIIQEIKIGKTNSIQPLYRGGEGCQCEVVSPGSTRRARDRFAWLGPSTAPSPPCSTPQSVWWPTNPSAGGGDASSYILHLIVPYASPLLTSVANQEKRHGNQYGKPGVEQFQHGPHISKYTFDINPCG
jgi:hypothetical protein